MSDALQPPSIDYRPGEWQARTMRRLAALGYGFRFGPGVRWWPTNDRNRKIAGPFHSSEQFDAWIAEQEADIVLRERCIRLQMCCGLATGERCLCRPDFARHQPE